jgi:hypothetical protein
MADNKYRLTQGVGTVSNGAATITLIAAPGAGKKLRVTWGSIGVTVAATGGGGNVVLKDGSNSIIIAFPASSVDSHYVEFGDDGIVLPENSALQLVAESAVTAQCTAYAAISAFIIG